MTVTVPDRTAGEGEDAVPSAPEGPGGHDRPADQGDLFQFDGAALGGNQTAGPRRIRYEPALDGLRGAAVLAVFLYHAELVVPGALRSLPLLSRVAPDQPVVLGGFLGVDAFFVLSGYLITRLLLAEWQTTDTISLRTFWSHRARRLLPPLFVGLGLVVLYALAFAPPDQLEQIRWDGLSTLTYVANWRFIASEQSYFQMFAFRSPLQHMWSLAIEEQWYLFWPLVVLAILKLRGRHGARAVFWTSVLLGAGSVLWMWLQFTPGADPSAVYWGTHTRAQSLLVGAALAAAVAGGLRLRREGSRRVVGWAGVVAMAALAVAWVRTPDSAEWIYDLGLPFLPVGGFLLLSLSVAFLIFASTQHGSRTNPSAAVLSVRPLRWLGLISYGVYVYHWPLFLILNPERTGLTGTALFVLRTAATLVLAVLSYRYLERPIRQGALGRRFRFAPALLPVTAVVTAIALLVSTRGAAATLEFAREKDASQRPPPTLDANDPSAADAERVLWVGDSVAYTLGLGLEGKVSEDHGLAFWNQAVLYCELLDGPRREKGKEIPASDTCRDWRETWRQDLEMFHPDVAVFQVGAWEIYDRKVGDEWLEFGTPAYDDVLRPVLREAIELLGSDGAQVVVLTTPNFARNDGASPVEWTVNDTRRTDHFNELLRQVVDDVGGRTRIVDLGGWFCPDGVCRETDGDATLRRDGLHFTDEGAVYVGRWLAPQLRDIAAGP